MAAYGGIVSAGAGGSVTSLRTGNLNVTGSDLCLICGSCEATSQNPNQTIVWDPDGNNEAMTGTFATISAGSYLDGQLEYLDDPTAANAPVQVSWNPANDETIVFGAFFTAAANIVATDTANDSFATSGTTLSATVPNVASGDMVIDFECIGYQNAITAGADQTARASNIDSGAYLRGQVTTQDGADGGVMSCTFADPTVGGLLIAARIPDAGGGGPTGPNLLTLLGVG